MMGVRETDVNEKSAGLLVGRDATEAFRMQAILGSLVVAQGDFTIEKGKIPPLVTMVVCTPSFLVTKVDGQCEHRPPNMPVTDAGLDGSTDLTSDADAGGADLTDADAGQQDRVPSCVSINLDGGSQTLPPPLPAPAGCNEYCALMSKNCSAYYRSPAVCALACAKLAWPPLGPGADSLQCRTAFATAAAAPDASGLNCENAEIFPRRQCGTSCAVYCRAGNQLCPSHFPDLDACVASCERTKTRAMANFPTRDFDYDVLLCRFDHIQEIVVDPGLCQLMAPNACVPGCPDLIL
jgi:hypothetical protein